MAAKQEPASPRKAFATLPGNGANKGKQRANDELEDIEMADWAQAQDPRMWDKLAGQTGATMSNLGDPVKTIEVRNEATKAVPAHQRANADESRTNGSSSRLSWPSRDSSSSTQTPSTTL
jgi:hypothetical protein